MNNREFFYDISFNDYNIRYKKIKYPNIKYGKPNSPYNSDYICVSTLLNGLTFIESCDYIYQNTSITDHLFPYIPAEINNTYLKENDTIIINVETSTSRINNIFIVDNIIEITGQIYALVRIKTDNYIIQPGMCALIKNTASTWCYIDSENGWKQLAQ